MYPPRVTFRQDLVKISSKKVGNPTRPAIFQKMPNTMHLKANQFKNADNNIFQKMPYTMHLKATQFKNEDNNIFQKMHIQCS